MLKCGWRCLFIYIKLQKDFLQLLHYDKEKTDYSIVFDACFCGQRLQCPAEVRPILSGASALDCSRVDETD